MAHYDHLPIFLEVYDLTVHIEKIVRKFSRYHKHTLGTDCATVAAPTWKRSSQPTIEMTGWRIYWNCGKSWKASNGELA
jgi:hypothetical protein